MQQNYKMDSQLQIIDIYRTQENRELYGSTLGLHVMVARWFWY